MVRCLIALYKGSLGTVFLEAVAGRQLHRSCILLELRKHAPGEVSSREKQEPSLGAQEGVCAKAASS